MALYDVSTAEKKVNPELVAGGTLYADNPLGTIIPFGGASIPSGWLLCDGAAISRTDYADLFSVIGESFGAGDGSTTFNLPDMRESVPVGSGTSDRSGITAHDSYTVGQFKDDQIQNFNLRTAEYNDPTGWVDGFVARGNGRYAQFRILYSNEQSSLSNNARVGTTTHGKQLGVNYIIKVKMVALPADFLAKVDEAVEDATPSVYYNADTNMGVEANRKSAIEYVLNNLLNMSRTHQTAFAAIRYYNGFYCGYVFQYENSNALSITETSTNDGKVYTWNAEISNDAWVVTLKQKLVTESDFNYKSGTSAGLNILSHSNTEFYVTFDTPMPDTDYVITVDTVGGAGALFVSVWYKKTTGFNVTVHNANDSIDLTNQSFKWQAFKIPH